MACRCPCRPFGARLARPISGGSPRRLHHAAASRLCRTFAMDDLKSETTSEVEASPDALEAAREAGLKWVNDTQPGIYRKKKGAAFIYVDHKGKQVRDEDQLYRARSLVIPPAWTDVWICASEHRH